jgi:hypothetical protein
MADPLLEPEVPGGAPGHADGKAGRRTDDDAAGTVGEGEPRHTQSLDTGGGEGALVIAAVAQVAQPGPERDVPVEAPQLFLGKHFGHDGGGGHRHRNALADRRGRLLIGPRIVPHCPKVSPGGR